MISLLMPTRDRPHYIIRLIDSILETADDPSEIELCLYIDEDDDSYDEMLEEDHGVDIKYTKGPRIVISDMWNKCIDLATGPLLQHSSDDFVFRSKSWDTKVKEHFDKVDDKILLLYGMDGHQNEKLGTLSFVHENWVEALSYIVPPYFDVDWCDNWINDIAVAVDRRVYDPEIYTEHLHPHAGKSEMDKTYTDREVIRQSANAHALYSKLAPLRLDDVDKLRKFIGSHA